jgi:hypothetical protein
VVEEEPSKKEKQKRKAKVESSKETLKEIESEINPKINVLKVFALRSATIKGEVKETTTYTIYEVEEIIRSVVNKPNEYWKLSFDLEYGGEPTISTENWGLVPPKTLITLKFREEFTLQSNMSLVIKIIEHFASYFYASEFVDLDAKPKIGSFNLREYLDYYSCVLSQFDLGITPSLLRSTLLTFIQEKYNLGQSKFVETYYDYKIDPKVPYIETFILKKLSNFFPKNWFEGVIINPTKTKFVLDTPDWFKQEANFVEEYVEWRDAMSTAKPTKVVQETATPMPTQQVSDEAQEIVQIKHTHTQEETEDLTDEDLAMLDDLTDDDLNNIDSLLD